MKDRKHALFLWLNAAAHLGALSLAVTAFFAQHAIWAIPASIGFGWLRGSEHTRKIMLEATASGLARLFVN